MKRVQRYLLFTCLIVHCLRASLVFEYQQAVQIDAPNFRDILNEDSGFERNVELLKDQQQNKQTEYRVKKRQSEITESYNYNNYIYNYFYSNNYYYYNDDTSYYPSYNYNNNYTIDDEVPYTGDDDALNVQGYLYYQFFDGEDCTGSYSYSTGYAMGVCLVDYSISYLITASGRLLA
jgi:hypothetical protein